MTQITLHIDNNSAADAIRSLVKNMIGVRIIADRSNRKSGFELAMEEIDAGDVLSYNSIDELIADAKK